jgi:hypothetical protein
MTSPEPPLRFSIRFDRSDLALGVEHDVYGLLEIVGEPEPTGGERPPLDLVIAVDGSGSMIGNYLEDAKSAAAFLVGRLGPADRIALIAFAEEPELLGPLVPPNPDLLGAIDAIRAGGRANLFAAWDMAVELLAAADERGSVRRVLLLTDGHPNLGETDTQALIAFARSTRDEQHVATTAFVFGDKFAEDFMNEIGQAGVVDMHFIWEPRRFPIALAEAFPGLASTEVLAVQLTEGIEFRDSDDRSSSERTGPRTVAAGYLCRETNRRHLIGLRVPTVTRLGPMTLGEVQLRSWVIYGSGEPSEIRMPLVVNFVPAGEAPSGNLDPEVTEAVAMRKYRAVKERWDRVQMRGTRQHLTDAAAELQGMGPVAAPLAEQLMRRVAEIDEQEERRRRLLEWCDLSPSGRLVVVRDDETVGWVPIEALPPARAEKATEDDRRLLMVSVAREAARIEEVVSGAPARVQLDGLPEEAIGVTEGSIFEWRFDPTRDFVPRPIPNEIVRWWEANRGLVSVRCNLHGEIARFDASRWIGMLGPAWDTAAVEYHNRWELRWNGTYDTPEFDGCEVRIEPTQDPGGANLLDVEQMWIVLEGNTSSWWPYEVLPRSEP